MRRGGAWLLVLAACLGPQDDPSQVRDLRVIGVRMDPPEIMADPRPLGVPGCGEFLGLLSLAASPPDAGSLGGLDGGVFDGGLPMISPDLIQQGLRFLYGAPIDTRWLIMDPAGAGRDIEYELRACARTSDLKCSEPNEFVSLAQGTTHAGELSFRSSLATALIGSTADGGRPDGGRPLLLEVVKQDSFRGLGGIRMPLVLHLKAGAEELYAQKLMVYSCKWFADSRTNVQPIIPGLKVLDEEWLESVDGGPTVTLSSKDDLEMVPLDFSAFEEDYVVPSLSLQPVRLKESWKFSWYTSLGRFSPTTSGGTAFTGDVVRPRSNWLPRIDGGTAGLFETDVDFWVVVRDGRGGESWIQRRAHFKP